MRMEFLHTDIKRPLLFGHFRDLQRAN